MIDLSADTGYTPSRLSPDLTDVVVSGRNVTLAGDCFGSSAGTVTLRKYVAGKDSIEIGSEVTDWRDKCVTLSLGEDFEGIMEAELTASNGKTDTIVKFISKRSRICPRTGRFTAMTPPRIHGAPARIIRCGSHMPPPRSSTGSYTSRATWWRLTTAGTSRFTTTLVWR